VKHGDTIVAISSAIGAAARMIVRVSGVGARGIVGQVCSGVQYEAGRAGYCGLRIVDCGLVGGWIYTFVGPRSYTGEDLVEFHLPGNVIVVNRLVEEIVKMGARRAEAGEFTARAYFNGRMDLSQAEGVAATISAHNEAELRAGRQLMAGELAKRLGPVMELIGETLALVEVGIDFSEEDVTFLSGRELRDRVGRARGMLEKVVGESARFERLSSEPVVVLVGRPNAGKSTLLNALAGEERAVVSDVAGTTRDAISALVRLKRGWVRVVDVAGVEERQGDKVTRGQGEEAKIERKMQEKARESLLGADVVVVVKEVGDEREELKIGREGSLVVWTKMDLIGGCARAAGSGGGSGLPLSLALSPGYRGEGKKEVRVSAVTGEGMGELREELDRICFGERAGGEALALNGRHLEAIGEARGALERGMACSDQGAEVVAMELREAMDRLGEVLGKVSPEEVLGRVFGKFCIGK